VFNVLLHEKKNFSHGRFINYEHLSGKMNIYLKTKNVSLYEEKLLKYMTEIEIIVLFRVMLTCQNDEEMNLYISNALHRINETELKLELTK